MAKSNRIQIGLTCSVCKSKNYTSQKNTVNDKDKLVLKKFCKTCRKNTEHNEAKVGK